VLLTGHCRVSVIGNDRPGGNAQVLVYAATKALQDLRRRHVDAAHFRTMMVLIIQEEAPPPVDDLFMFVSDYAA
jgi:hypothetical protein